MNNYSQDKDVDGKDLKIFSEIIIAPNKLL